MEKGGNKEPKHFNCSIYIDSFLAIRTMPFRFRKIEKIKMKLKLLPQLASMLGYDTIVSMITDTYM